MATIFDVARRAGVSITTVSHVFSGKRAIASSTRERVLRAAQDLNYAPSRAGQALALGRSFTVAILLPNPLDLCLVNPSFSEMVLTITEACSLAGYGVLVYGATPGAVNDDLRLAVEQRNLDGVVWIDPHADDDLLDGFLASSGIPLVVGGTPTRPDRVLHVRNDRREVARLALHHLVELGHREVALMLGPRHLMAVRDYFAAYRAVAPAVEPDLRLAPVYTPSWTIRNGRDALDGILDDRPAVSAVIAGNESLAVGAIQAARDRGRRVPQDVAVLCHGNAHLAAHFSPGITAIDVHTRETGLALVRRLLDLIDGKTEGNPLTIVPATLVVRESTDPTMTQ